MNHPSATTLYVVRHGETEYNRLGRVQGRGIDSPLNATGHHQAEALAQRLADVPFQAIYTSTLRRTHQTAAPLQAQQPSVPTYPDPDLDEMNWGHFEGQARSPEIEAAYRRIRAQWAEGIYDQPIPGGESVLEVQARGLRALARITKAHAGGTVLLVSHGRFLKILLASILSDGSLATMDELLYPNTALTLLRYEADTYTAPLLVDRAHLDPTPYSLS
ncbi:MAG: histidine phosphatase family protein [Bacteroidota bacterium]